MEKEGDRCEEEATFTSNEAHDDSGGDQRFYKWDGITQSGEGS